MATTSSRNTHAGKRPPFNRLPLRAAGQSVREARDELIFDKLMPWYMAAALFVVLAAMEWFRYFRDAPPQPGWFTFAALVVVTAAVYRFSRIIPQARRLKLAAQGERVVGECLEELREHGYRILHDIVADSFNIDHVIIGPGGVFAIETKTRSKPLRGRTEINYDGAAVSINGRAPVRDPIIQAKGQARWLRQRLKESTGRDWPVTAVVLYPGWYVNHPARETRPEVWVHNERYFVSVMTNRARTLTPEQVALAYDQLSLFVLARETQPA